MTDPSTSRDQAADGADLAPAAPSRRTPWIAGAALAVAALAAAGGWWLFGRRGGDGGGARERPPTPVEVAVARVGTVAVTAETTGTLRARERVVLTTEVSGRVEAIRFAEGASVDSGAVVVALDREEDAARLAEARALRDEAAADLRRAEALTAEDVRPPSELDAARAAYEAAEARVALAADRHEEKVIRAPFAGRVGLRRVSPGDLLQPGDPVATLDATGPLELAFEVPASLLARLRPGLGVRAAAENLPGPFTGEVARIDPRVDDETRTIELEARVPDPTGALRPGLLVTVDLVLEERAGVLAPEAAVVLEGGEARLYVVARGEVERRTVTLGERRRGEVEVTEGLAPGERVVVRGVQGLRDGQAVAPEERAPAGAAPADGADGRPGGGDGAEG